MTDTKKDRFDPFADEASVRNVGGLSIENSTARIAVHGSLDITKDRIGLDQARLLRETFEAVVKALEAADLPGKVAEAADIAPKRVKNPFA